VADARRKAKNFVPRSGKTAHLEAIHENLRDLEDCRIIGRKK